MKKMICAAAVVGVMLAGVAVYAAQTETPAPRGALGLTLDGHVLRDIIGRLRGLREELGLTNEQKMALGGILREKKPEIVTVITNLRDKHRRMADLALADNTNEAALRAAARDLGAAIGDGAILRARLHKAIYAVLTPEQRAKADSARSEIRGMVDDRLAEIAAQ